MTARHDRAGHGLAKPIRRPDGKWIVRGRAARVHRQGDELAYPWGREMRDATGLQSIAGQMPGIVVNVEHDGPRIGVVESAEIQGEHVVVTMILDSIDALSTHGEISLGYRAACDARGYQHSITVHELALVPRGRCGRSCRVQMDACCTTCAETAARERMNERFAARNFGSTSRGHSAGLVPGARAVDPPIPAEWRRMSAEWIAMQGLTNRGGK